MHAFEKVDVVTVGEPMALFIAQQEGPLDEVTSFSRAVAGAELNVATGLARLGLKVSYLSRVGDDSFGRQLLAFMDREGIDRSHVTVDPRYPTGFMLKSLTRDGSDPAVEYFRKGSAASHLSVDDHPAQMCALLRHLHLTGISPALSADTCDLVFAMARAARLAGRSVSFDPNLRPRLWPSQAAMRDCLNRLACCCDWVLPGLNEGRLLTGADTPEEIADFYLARGVSTVVVKLGADGAYYAGKHERGHVPGVAVERVVDTVGAGDAFAVGVISGLMEGLTLPMAVARGNYVGARVVQFPGDCDGLPTRTEMLSTAMPDTDGTASAAHPVIISHGISATAAA